MYIHAIRKIAEIDFLESCRAGPYVLRMAHRIDKTNISTVCFQGKKNLV